LGNEQIMRKTFPLLAAVVAMGLLATGCAKTEKKLGRGLSNTAEIVRWGEFRRTMEQTAVFEGPDSTGVGVVRGIARTLGRTGIGIYEVVTCPLPPYDPVATDYFAPGPVYPDNYAPGLRSDSMYDTDTFTGYSGGDIAPKFPGSRFTIFDGVQ
jgi:putative exosortase-associated protein (TIGR04073 family)